MQCLKIIVCLLADSIWTFWIVNPIQIHQNNVIDNPIHLTAMFYTKTMEVSRDIGVHSHLFKGILASCQMHYKFLFFWYIKSWYFWIKMEKWIGNANLNEVLLWIDNHNEIHQIGSNNPGIPVLQVNYLFLWNFLIIFGPKK